MHTEFIFSIWVNVNQKFKWLIIILIYYYKWIIQVNTSLNRAKDYYENDKRLREQARDKYRNISEKDKKKKREYGKNRYHNTPEEKKQKLKKYQKIYRELAKSNRNNK